MKTQRLREVKGLAGVNQPGSGLCSFSSIWAASLVCGQVRGGGGGVLSLFTDKPVGSSQTHSRQLVLAFLGEHLSLSQTICLCALFQKAFSFHDVEGLYLLTDGKPDSSCSLILREVQRLKEKRDVKIHTISLNRSGR